MKRRKGIKILAKMFIASIRYADANSTNIRWKRL